MKIILFTLFLLKAISIEAQPIPKEYCPVDTSKFKFTYLSATIYLNDTTSKSTEYLQYQYIGIDEFYMNMIYNGCAQYLLKYNKIKKQYCPPDVSEEQLLHWPSYYSHKFQPEKIRTLNIDVIGTSYEKFNINKADFIQKIDFSKINSLTVGSRLSKIRITPKNIINRDSILYLGLFGFDVHKFDNLIKYRNLEELYCPQYINRDLIYLKKLKKIKVENPYYFFSNNLILLPKLESFEFFIYHNQFRIFSLLHEIKLGVYPQLSFFFQNLSLKIPNHPINLIDSVIKVQFSEKMVGTKRFSILMGDFNTEKKLEKNRSSILEGDLMIESSIEKDTLACGDLVDGKKVGIWKYRVFGNYLLYNHSKNEIVTFPKNGHWKYYYPTGELAIEGEFKNGLKTNQWKFYDLNGKISSIKTYENDEPKGLFIDFDLNGKETRRYYKNSRVYKTQVMCCGQSDTDLSEFGDGSYPLSFISRKKGISTFTKGKKIKEIKIGSRKYKRLTNKYFLKYLYPDKKENSPAK